MKSWMLKILLGVAGVGVLFYVVGSNTLGGMGDYRTQAELEAPQMAASEPSYEMLASLGYLESPAQSDRAAARGNVAHAATMEASMDRYLVKNAMISLETQNAREAAELIVAKVAALGGYVGNLSEVEAAFGATNVQLTVRVPADGLEEALAVCDGLGKVLRKSITSQDMTEEYVDVEARLHNLQQTEARLLDHLGRTGNLEDILLVENELTRVREQIERLEGRLRFLKDRVAFSTINISLQEAPGPEPMVPATTFSTGQVFTQAFRSLVALLQGLWVVVIWAGVWALVWVPLGLAVWWLVRRHLNTENRQAVSSLRN